MKSKFINYRTNFLFISITIFIILLLILMTRHCTLDEAVTKGEDGDYDEKSDFKMGTYHQVKDCQRKEKKDHENLRLTDSDGDSKPEVRLALTVCSERLEQTIIVLKSAILFSKQVKLFAEIFKNDATSPQLTKKLKQLQEEAIVTLNVSFKFRLHDVKFPGGHEEKWRTFYTPCPSQRLFLPQLLPDVDSVIYLDTDFIFLSNVRELWNHFSYMNDQVVGMALEDDGYYATYGKTPYYDKGLNAGIMLMNLTKMRINDFQNEMLLIMDAYNHDELLNDDQDIFNIYFHYHPCDVYEISCVFNYGFEHCACPQDKILKDCHCKNADTHGVALVHGQGANFQGAEFLREIYNDFRMFNVRTGDPGKLIRGLEQKFLNNDSSKTSCFKIDQDHKMMLRARQYANQYFQIFFNHNDDTSQT